MADMASQDQDIASQHRNLALQALKDAHGSYGKAAAATGIPKSTLHAWAQGKVSLQRSGAIESALINSAKLVNTSADAGVSAGRRGQRSMDGSSPDPGAERDLETEGEARNGADERHDQERRVDNELEMDPHAGEEWDDAMQPVPSSRYRDIADVTFLRALYRYSNLIANGLNPDQAMTAAQHINEDFYLADHEQDRLAAAIDGLQKKFKASEAEVYMVLAETPAWLNKMAKGYGFGPDNVGDLTDAIYSIKQDAYTTGINSALDDIGLDPLDKITDQDTLDQLRSDAEDTASGIAETWKNDVTTAAQTIYAEAMADETLESRDEVKNYVDDQLQSWFDDHLDWKSAQIATTESSSSLHDAYADWMDNNGSLIQSAYVAPDDCQCQKCCDLTDQAGANSNLSADELNDIIAEIGGGDSLPYHPGCIHEIVLDHKDDAKDSEVWTPNGTIGGEDDNGNRQTTDEGGTVQATEGQRVNTGSMRT